MNKKGFTLVELLAVIAIMGVLLIIAVPNIVETLRKARRSTFTEDIQSIYKVAVSQATADSIGKRHAITYCRKNGEACEGYEELELTGSKAIDYVITVDEKGMITFFAATNGTFEYTSSMSYTIKTKSAGGDSYAFDSIEKKENTGILELDEITEDDVIEIINADYESDTIDVASIIDNYDKYQNVQNGVITKGDNAFMLDVNMLYKGKRYCSPPNLCSTQSGTAASDSGDVMRFEVYINGKLYTAALKAGNGVSDSGGVKDFYTMQPIGTRYKVVYKGINGHKCEKTEGHNEQGVLKGTTSVYIVCE